MDQHIQYLAQVCNDFAATLPLAARGPFVQTAQRAIEALRAALPKPLPKEGSDVPSE